jgi:hypothetical protein
MFNTLWGPAWTRIPDEPSLDFSERLEQEVGFRAYLPATEKQEEPQ